MKQAKKLRRLERRLSKAKAKLKKLEERKVLKRAIITARKDCTNLQDAINQLVCEHLEQTNAEFKRIAELNYKLLATARLEFKTRSKGKALRGRMQCI